MALLLNIDTATEYASISLTQNGEVIGFAEHADQRNHGAFLQPAIQQIIKNSGHQLQNIDAISVSNGPGSYTGLRVGLASAKGLCYALNKPLITINTLEVMALAAIKEVAINNNSTNKIIYFCPLIDARRMEVFTAIYNKILESVLQPSALIIDENSFSAQLSQHLIVFSGSGHQKVKTILKHQNAIYSTIQHTAKHLGLLAEKAFQQKNFTNLAYSEPFYLKEFFSPTKNLKIS